MRVAGFLLLLALAAASGREKTFDEKVEDIEQRFVRRLHSLARKVESWRCYRYAGVVWERILVIDPDHQVARKKRGYTRENGRWVRTKEEELRVGTLANASSARVLDGARQLNGVEDRFLDEILEACADGTESERREVLERLLERMPGREKLHRALGHQQFGESWVRPALLDLYRRMAEEQAAWASRRYTRRRPHLTEKTLRIPGTRTVVALLRVGDREVSGDLDSKEVRELAHQTEAPHQLMKLVLTDRIETWDRNPVLFLQPDTYDRVLTASIRDPSQLKVALNYGSYDAANFRAIYFHNLERTRDFYAHSVAFHTAQRLLVPEKDAGSRRWRAHAWYKEGFALFVTFELYGTGWSWTASPDATTRRILYTRDPPRRRTRGACLRWLREQMLDGETIPLPEVFGRSLNNLDFLAMMEAYTFVRFLFLFDGIGAARFPHLLAAQKTAPPHEQADNALRAAFEKGTRDLERLWRAYILEIGPR